MKIISIILLILLLPLTKNAYSSEGFIVQDAIITKLISGRSTHFAIETTGGTGPCTNIRLQYFLDNNSIDSQAVNRAFSLLTTALVTKNKVSIWADDTNNCNSGWSIDLSGE